MDDVKKLLNSLKCPICHAQIDTISGKGYGYNYCCAANSDHYVLCIDLGSLVTRITREKVHVYDKNHKYSIIKAYHDGTIRTSISVYETDLEGRVIFSFKDKVLMMDKDLFDFANFKPDKAVHRIKTIFVFQ